MIVLEFIIFVVSSGLFCSERFRNHLWAVLVAGAIATGSSLLFFYHLGTKMVGQEPPPTVITKVVKVPVVKTVLPSQKAAASKDKPHICGDDFYPVESRNKGEEGVTKLAFHILTDGTVGDVKVVATSGFPHLDDAAVKCVGNWHYQPAIKDGKLAEVASGAAVKWVLPKPDAAKTEATAEAAPAEKKTEPLAANADAGGEPQRSHHWYDPRSWFSSSSDTDKKAQAQPVTPP